MGKHLDSEEERREDYFSFTPSFVTIVRDDNKLISMCYVYLRETTFNNTVIHFAGIGEVVTHMEHRYKGNSKLLLQTALTELKNRKVDVAMLTTDIKNLGHVYEIHGFIPLGRPYIFISRRGIQKSEATGMIVPVNSKKVFYEIVNSKEILNVGLSNF